MSLLNDMSNILSSQPAVRKVQAEHRSTSGHYYPNKEFITKAEEEREMFKKLLASAKPYPHMRREQ